MGAFEDWYIAQHGKRPGNPTVSDSVLRDRVRAGQVSEAILARREQWDREYHATLRAWMARDEAKRGEE